MATLEVINIGASPNDGEGDPLRTAFQKVNNNFASMWASNFNTLESITTGNSSQIIFTTPVVSFTQAAFQINSNDTGANSQNIVINAAISNDGANVKWTGHSTTFNGSPVTRYNMDVAAGNVNLYAIPLVTGQAVHFIAYQVTFNPQLAGIAIALDGDAANVLGTENLQILTTES